MYALRIYEGRVGFDYLMEIWNNMDNKSDLALFKSWDWYECLLDMVGYDDVKFLVILKPSGDFTKKDNPLVIFPIRYKKGIIEFIYSEHMNLYDVIGTWNEEESLIDVLYYLLKKEDIKWNKMVFYNIFSGSTLYKDIERMKSQYFHINRIGYNAFISGGELSLKASLSRNIKSKYKKLETKKTPFFFEFKNDNIAYQKFLEIEGSGWKGKEGSAIKCKKSLISFYDCIRNKFNTEISFFVIDGVRVSSFFSVRHNNTIYCLKIGYLEDYKSFSPGIIHHKMFIEIEPKEVEVNFISDNISKLGFEMEKREIVGLTIYNKTFTGMRSLFLLKMNKLLEKIKVEK